MKLKKTFTFDIKLSCVASSVPHLIHLKFICWGQGIFFQIL